MTAAADIHAIREQLKEARRYAGSDPVTCEQMITESREDINLLLFSSPGLRLLVARWIENLKVAVDSLLVDPGVAKSYLYAVVHELGQLHSDLVNAATDNSDR